MPATGSGPVFKRHAMRHRDPECLRFPEYSTVPVAFRQWRNTACHTLRHTNDLLYLPGKRVIYHHACGDQPKWLRYGLPDHASYGECYFCCAEYCMEL